MKILVTGAAGFIGSHALAPLVAKGHDVLAVSSTQRSSAAGGVTWLQADLLDPADTTRVLERVRPDVLLHLAWYTHHGRFWSAAENFIWSQATVHLLQGFQRAGGRRAVVCGTCAEYDWSHGWCVEGVTPTHPSTIYGKSKDLTRQFAEEFARANGIEFAWARLFLPYGPGEPVTRLIPSVLTALQKGEAVRCSHGQQFRDFIHVRDVAAALAQLATTGQVEGAYNIGAGQPVRIADVVKACVAEFPESASSVQFGAYTHGADDPGMLVASIDRLRSTGWTPSVSLQAGLAEYALSIRENARAETDAQ